MIINRKWLPLFFLILSFLTYFLLPPEISEVGKRVISVFVFAVFFWAFEAAPLYATSLLVIVFLSFFFIDSEGVRQYELFFSSFSNPLILLFFGGFVLAAALRKHRVDEFVLSKMMYLVGDGSYAVLGGILFTSAFFSLWISNTAAAAMMLAVCKPLFQNLAKEDSLRKSLPLAIAFGCNIGGMGTPIGSPPNAIALGILNEYGINIDFIGWMYIAIPLVILILAFVFFLLVLFFPLKSKTIGKAIGFPSSLSHEGLKTGGIALLMIFFWLSGGWHGISETWVAL
ncbi:MAG: hypothetical protein COT85_00490, partial [Chlamydiae bacterium CG10_big_fil_rev_8_21_14_0_10_42_34]